MRIFIFTTLSLLFLSFTPALAMEVTNSERDRVEQTFKNEIQRAQVHLQSIYSQGLITESELAEGLQLSSDYQEQTFVYLEFLLDLQESPDEESYLYALDYHSSLLNMLVMNPNARIDEITPEVMDFVPARELCPEPGESQDECVEHVIADRQQQIFSSIEERNHANQEDFFVAARLGIIRSFTYAQLIGIIHHQAENFRRSEVLDVQDRLIGSTNQDLNEGY